MIDEQQVDEEVDEQVDEPTLPTPEERALTYYREYMGHQKSDVPFSIVKDHVVRKVADDIEHGKVADDAKTRAEKAFGTVDGNERSRANKQMRSGQMSFNVGEQDLIVALASQQEFEQTADDGTVSTTLSYSQQETTRCRIGAIGLGQYLRWDFLQDANRRAANEAYDKGKARFAPYLPFFQQGLTIKEIHAKGLIPAP